MEKHHGQPGIAVIQTWDLEAQSLGILILQEKAGQTVLEAPSSLKFRFFASPLGMSANQTPPCNTLEYMWEASHALGIFRENGALCGTQN